MDAAKLAIAAALLLAGFAAGWGVQGWRADARVSALLSAQAQRDAQAADLVAQAERDNTARLQRAMTAADAAIALAQSRAEAATTHATELRYALDAATSRTRQCLSADAVRLLNTPAAPGASGPGLRVPAHSGSAAQPAAAPAADPAGSGASERAIALWITEAHRLYDTCRGRVDAIRAWAQQTAAP